MDLSLSCGHKRVANMQTCTGPAQQMQVSRMQSLAAEELRNFKPSQHHPGSHTVSKLPSYRANTVLSRKQRQKQRWTVAASRSGQEPKGPKDVKSIRRLPIFPLQVAMPFVPCALNIFEARSAPSVMKIICQTCVLRLASKVHASLTNCA